MAETVPVQTIPQEADALQQCCEPACPDACESEVVAVETPVAVTTKQAAATQCCEPECGPDTC